MRDEIIRDEVASLNKNENLKAQLGAGSGGGGGGISDLPRMYGSSGVVVADTRNAVVPVEPSWSSNNNNNNNNETRRRNLTKNMGFSDDNNENNKNNNNNNNTTDDNNDNNNTNIVATDDDPSRYITRLTKPKTYDYSTMPVKYDFQNLGTAFPMVLMPTATVATSAPVNPLPPPSTAYYTLDNCNYWQPNFNDETYPVTQVPNSDYFIANPTNYSVDTYNDYYYPIACGMRNDQQASANYWPANPYADTSTVELGYAAPSPQPWVVPHDNSNYYTSLQPQNFYANLMPGVPPGIPPQFICKRDCTPTTRFPTTRCTRRPGSPQPAIAWENNNTCCCELCGVACKAQFNQGKGPRYGPCKPPPLPMPNNRNALYCHGRRRKREYYLSAPKARQRLQKESDRCRMTTTTTPKPKPWPTEYPIKFRLQKSVDTGIPVANQVSNIPMSPAAALIFENQHQHRLQRENVATNDKIQVVNGSKPHKPVKLRSKNVPETASSKLRKKHNEIRMQELQETLEIALERMNQEINE